MGAPENSISKASTLLAERRKYEGWLAALDQRRATTPEHVFTRVRADYQARLEAVVAEMASNAEALEGRVQELAERAESLRAEAQAVQDRRAEAELRAHVGELEVAAWEAASRDAEERLKALEAERAALDEELASIRELAVAARTPTPAASSIAVPPPATRGADTAAAPASSSPSDAVADRPDVEPVLGAAGGEGRESESMAAGAGEGAAGGDAPIVTGAGAVNERSANFDELAFLRDITGMASDAAPVVPAEAAEPPAQRQAPERPVDDSLGLVLPNDAPAIAPSRRASVEVPMAANVASNIPIVIKPDAGRQGKTLKCTECGSMNYPTEWYCERCGAELSAL